jgi:hypothetical protein
MARHAPKMKWSMDHMCSPGVDEKVSQLIQPQCRHFGILAATSAKTDPIFWKIFEETLFTLIIII